MKIVFFHIGQTAKTISSTHPGLCWTNHKGFLPPHLSIWHLPPTPTQEIFFLHIKHSVILNKCIIIISLFKHLLILHFSQLQRELLFLQPHREEYFRSALLITSFWRAIVNTSSHMSDVVKCTCQWRLLQSWYFKENVQSSPRESLWAAVTTVTPPIKWPRVSTR